MSGRNTGRGFTVVELVIVVAIVGVLLSIAIPIYRNYTAQAKRADAAAVLTEAAQFMERNFSEAARYDKTAAGLDIVFPPSLTTVPRGSSASEAYYTVSFAEGPSAAAYRLQAVPTNSMTGDECGTLSINWQGKRTISGSIAFSQCWR